MREGRPVNGFKKWGFKLAKNGQRQWIWIPDDEERRLMADVVAWRDVERMEWLYVLDRLSKKYGHFRTGKRLARDSNGGTIIVPYKKRWSTWMMTAAYRYEKKLQAKEEEDGRTFQL